jgi:hypothetical protein
LCFEDANTLCIIEEKSPQGWGLERNEITWFPCDDARYIASMHVGPNVKGL